jgi:cell wall-associated NlpC family hydrolase
MSSFRQDRPLATGSLAILLTLGPLAGCARVPINLEASPSRGPTVRATIDPITIARTRGAEGFGVSVGSGTAVPDSPRRDWPRPVVSASAAQVLATADRYVGTRYRYGGESPTEGFDCSGFVQFVYGRSGVELPRVSYQQARAGRAAPGEITALQPGDLMFFSAGGRRVDHVAIYAGDGRIIHAASGAGSVRYDGLETDRGEWLLRRFVTSRRVLSGVRET